MYNIDRILVALDLTEMDDSLIRYTSFMAKLFNTDKIYFFHVADSYELPEEVKKNYPDLVAPKDETIIKLLEDKIKTEWVTDYTCEISIELKEGNAIDQLLKWIDIKSVDMILMGRKDISNGSGVMPQKVSKLAHSSVLIVPEISELKLDKMVIPLDFSKHSKLAMEAAISIAKVSGAEIIALNAYYVPSGYHKAGKSREEFAEIMKGHAEADFKKFMIQNDFDQSIPCHFVLDEGSPADKIYEYAEEVNADLLIMGSKGRTGIASILLGSVTEKVINYKSHMPLAIIKDKDENMGFLKALLKL